MAKHPIHLEMEALTNELAIVRGELAWQRHRADTESKRADLWMRRATGSTTASPIATLTRLVGRLQDEVRARDVVLAVEDFGRASVPAPDLRWGGA